MKTLLDDRIRNLGKSLNNRIDKNLINSALEYIDFSESFLAFETLCDYIDDFDVQLTEEESQEISFINKEFGVESKP